MLDERSVQTISTPFNIFKNKENVESMLNKSLNQFKIDSTQFQQTFNIFNAFNNVEQPIQTPPDFWFNNCVERELKQMLKPFKRVFTCIQYVRDKYLERRY